MKKINKTFAFIFGMVCIIGMFAVVLLFHAFDKATTFPVGSFLTAVVGLVTSYMGIEVVNNGVRGKCFEERVAKLDAENRGIK
jgi:hypothetical protein